MNIYTDEEFNDLMSNLSSNDSSKKEEFVQQDKDRQRYKKEQMQMASILKRTVLELKKAKSHVNHLEGEIHAKKEEHSSILAKYQQALNEIQKIKSVDHPFTESFSYVTKDDRVVHQEALKKCLIDLKSARSQIKILEKQLEETKKTKSDIFKAHDHSTNQLKDIEHSFQNLKNQNELQQQKFILLENEKRVLLRAQSELENLRQRQVQMADALKKALEQIKEKNLICENLELELNQLKRQDNSLDEENVHLRKLIDDLKSSSHNLKEQEAVARNDLAAVELSNMELLKEVSTLKELLEQTQSHFLDKQKQHEELQKEYAAYEIEHQNLKQQLEHLHKDYSYHQKKLLQNEEKETNFIKQIKELEKNLENAKGEKEQNLLILKSQAEDLASKEQKIFQLQQLIEEEKKLKESAYQLLQNQKIDSENELMLWHERLMQEKEDHQKLKEMVQKKDEDLQELCKKIQQLEWDLKILADQLHQEQESYRIAQTEHQELLSEIDTKNSEIQNLKNSFKEYKEQENSIERQFHARRIELESQILELQKKSVDAEKKQAEIKQEWEKFRAEKERECSSLYENLATIQRENLTLSYETERQISDKDAQLASLSDQLNTSKKIIEDLNNQLKNEQGELRALISQWQERCEVNEQEFLNQKNHFKEIENQKDSEIYELTSTVAELEHEKKILNEKISSTKNSIIALQQSQNEFKIELDDLKSNHENELTKVNQLLVDEQDINSTLLDEIAQKFEEKNLDTQFYNHLLNTEIQEKDKWQEAWEKAKCELAKSREEYVNLDEKFFESQQHIAHLEEEKNALLSKEKEWLETSKNFELIWNQTKEKSRQTLEAKERELTQLKSTFKITLEQSQQKAALTLAKKQQELEFESKKLQDFLTKSAEIEEKQNNLMGKLQSEVRTAWLQVQEFQEKINEQNEIISKKEILISHHVEQQKKTEELLNSQALRLQSLEQSLEESNLKCSKLEKEFEQEKQQALQQLNMSQERLDWNEEQLKQAKEHNEVLQNRLQESQNQVAQLEKAKREYEAFMNNFKSFVSQTIPSQQSTEQVVPKVNEPVTQETPILETSLPFGTVSPYLSKKTKSDLFDATS